MQMNDGRRRSSAWKRRRAGAGHYFSHAGGETQRAAPAGTVIIEGDYFDACGGFEDVALGAGYDWTTTEPSPKLARWATTRSRR